METSYNTIPRRLNIYYKEIIKTFFSFILWMRTAFERKSYNGVSSSEQIKNEIKKFSTTKCDSNKINLEQENRRVICHIT